MMIADSRPPPTLRSDMAERLSNIVFAQQYGPLSSSHQQQQQSNQNHFNPRQISLDIRTPEELAAVNEFLIQLGRNVTSNGLPSSHQPPSSSSRQQQHPLTPEFTPHSADSPSTYFDSVGLTQLGIANMPGIASLSSSFGSTSSDYQSGGYSPPHRPGSGRSGDYASSGTLYPAFDERPAQRARMGAGSSYPQTISLSPSPHTGSPTSATPTRGSFHAPQGTRISSIGSSASMASAGFRPTPPLSSGSPDSSIMGSVSSAGPSPHMHPTTVHIPAFPQQGSSQQQNQRQPDGAANFDFLAPRSSGLGGAAPGLQQPQLGSYEFSGARALRTVVPLKSAPGRAGEDEEEEGEQKPRTRYVLPPLGPMEPRLKPAIQRGPPAKLPSSSSSASPSPPPSTRTLPKLGDSNSLYPVLTASDMRLPPIVGRSGGSAASRSRASTSSYAPYSSARRPAPGPSRLRSSSPQSDGSRTPSPAGSPRQGKTVLPSLRTLAADLDVEFDERDRQRDRDRRVDGALARGVSSIRLSSRASSSSAVAVSEEERRKHAELIRDMLVAINTDYKQRYGTPPPASPARERRERERERERERDVEMSAA